MNAAHTPKLVPLSEAEMQTLQALLDQVPAPLQALDLSSLDGYLCGVLLQPKPVAPASWLAHVLDVDGQAAPAGFDLNRLHALVLRRHAELNAAINQREWFDPWVFMLEEEASPSDSVLPWIAGFATAMELFPQLASLPDPELVEPLATLYMHIDRADLEDADALLEVIDTLEPPKDLSEAVDDLVRSVMLMADVSRPRAPVRSNGPRPPQRRRR